MSGRHSLYLLQNLTIHSNNIQVRLKTAQLTEYLLYETTKYLKPKKFPHPMAHVSHVSPVRWAYQSGVLTCQVFSPVRCALPVRCSHPSVVFTCQVCLSVRCAHLSGVLTCQVCLPVRCTYLSGVFTCQVYLPVRCAHLSVVLISCSGLAVTFVTLVTLILSD